MKNQTFTITFGDQAENHVGMQKIGEKRDEGFSRKEMKSFSKYFKEKGYKVKLVHLNKFLDDEEAVDAYVLRIRKGLKEFLPKDKKISDFAEEQLSLEKDSKALMYGRVVNKIARHNLCFSDKSQKPKYEEGKGTIVAFDDLPLLKSVREKLPSVFGEKAKDLQAEGNYYYNIKKCGIGYHGDSERRVVIGVRLGEELPLCFQWHLGKEKLGEKFEMKLKNGDMYIMSEKAVGTDWKKRSIPTLRHAAGCEKYIS